MRNGHTTTSAYKMTPQLHESALRPSYLIPCKKKFRNSRLIELRQKKLEEQDNLILFRETDLKCDKLTLTTSGQA